MADLGQNRIPEQSPEFFLHLETPHNMKIANMYFLKNGQPDKNRIPESGTQKLLKNTNNHIWRNYYYIFYPLGASLNYVDRIFDIFDHPSPLVDKCWHLANPPSPFACQRSLWTAPKM